MKETMILKKGNQGCGYQTVFYLLLLGCMVLFTFCFERNTYAAEPTMDGSTVITFSNPWMKKHVKEGLAREWAVSPTTIQDSDLTVSNLATIKTFLSESNPNSTWNSMNLTGIQYLSGLERFEVYAGLKSDTTYISSAMPSESHFMDVTPFKSGLFTNLKEFRVRDVPTIRNTTTAMDVSSYYGIFEKMPNLQVLHLNLSYIRSTQNIKSLLVNILKTNKELLELDLLLNSNETDASFLNFLPKLETMSLLSSRMNFCNYSGTTISNLKKIQVKDSSFLMKNRSDFWNVPNVRELNFDRMKLYQCGYTQDTTEFSPDFFKNMPFLESVYIKNLFIYDLTPFVGLEKLDVLSVQIGYVYEVPPGINATIQDFKYNYIPNQPYQYRWVFNNTKQFVKVSDLYQSTTPPYDKKLGYYLPVEIQVSDANLSYTRADDSFANKNYPILNSFFDENVPDFYSYNAITNEKWAPIAYTTVLRPQSGIHASNPNFTGENTNPNLSITGAYFRTDEIYSPFSHFQFKFVPLAKYANPKYAGTWKWDFKFGDIPVPIEFEFLPDETPPSFDVVPSVNGWTNGAIKIYLRNLDDDYSGIETFVNFNGTKTSPLAGRIVNEKYSYNNIETNIANNGTYSFKMMDAAGNETTKTLVVNTIDKIEPTAKLENTTTIKSTKNTLKFSDLTDDVNGSGVKGVYLPNNTFVSGTDDVYYDVYERGYYTFGVQDNAGNVKYYSIKVENVYGEDKTPPSISFVNYSGEWSKELKEIQILIEDDNAYNSEYAWTNNPSDEKSYQPLTSNLVRQRTDKDRYLHVRATDFDENTAEKMSDKIQVDLTAPTFEVVYDDKKWVQTDLELLLTNFSDDNGSGVDYVILPDKNIVYNPMMVSYRVSENGVYFVEVADKVGNRKRVNIEAFNIDSKKPMVKVTQKEAGDNLKIINVYGKDE